MEMLVPFITNITNSSRRPKILCSGLSRNLVKEFGVWKTTDGEGPSYVFGIYAALEDIFQTKTCRGLL